MSLYKPFSDQCPPAYGGCTCSCHRVPHTYHCMPCCYPGMNDDFGEPMCPGVIPPDESVNPEEKEDGKSV